MSQKRKLQRTLYDYMDPNAKKDDNSTNLPPKKKRKLQKATNKNDSHLFTDDNPTTTVHGTGFNSKAR